MADDKKPPNGYDVGYRKPPKHTQFKQGESGNPSGRPKGAPNLATALDRALKEQVVVSEGGRRRSVSKMEAMVTQMVNKATVGDPRARQQLLQVLRVMDGGPAEATNDADLAQEDQEIMKRITDRLTRTAK